VCYNRVYKDLKYGGIMNSIDKNVALMLRIFTQLDALENWVRELIDIKEDLLNNTVSVGRREVLQSDLYDLHNLQKYIREANDV
jgi:hypothetical protein